MPPFDPPRTDAIRIRGARQNNLKDLDLDLPLNEIAAMTGTTVHGAESRLLRATQELKRRMEANRGRP